MKRDLPRRAVIIVTLELMGWQPLYDEGMDPIKDGHSMSFNYVNSGRSALIANYGGGWEWDIPYTRIDPIAYPPVPWSRIKTSVLRQVLQEVSDGNRP